MQLHDKDDIVSEYHPARRVEKEIQSLSNKEIRDLERAGDSGTFWEALNEVNEERSPYADSKEDIPVGFDAARTLANHRGIDLEEQDESLEFKDKLAAYVKAGITKEQIANHLYMDLNELRDSLPGKTKRRFYFNSNKNPDAPRIIDEAYEGKDSRQISEELDLNQSEAAEVMRAANFEGFSRHNTFEETRKYENNHEVNPEAAIYWFLENEGAASPEKLSDFLTEAADYDVETHEINQIMMGLEEEGRVESELAKDSYTGVDQNTMYSIGFKFGDVELGEGQEKLLEDVVKHKISSY